GNRENQGNKKWEMREQRQQEVGTERTKAKRRGNRENKGKKTWEQIEQRQQEVGNEKTTATRKLK
ncbi:hypothetical protein QQ73_09895, partial [Candidatus Endoriftia persephone str. Guaymas]|nr:hypothetical protein [Candidatus Endoriftia persephone str. Guaymas]